MTKFAVLFGVIAIGASCNTTYDAYGRPQSSVSGSGVAAAAGVAGLTGLLIGRNNPRKKGGHNPGGHHPGGHHGHHGHP